MHIDPEKVLANIRRATTEELLQRAILERGGMEPDALRMIANELRERGVGQEEMDRYEADHRDCLRDGLGRLLHCGVCRKPALVRVDGWHRLWGMVPLFPRTQYYCREHRPK